MTQDDKLPPHRLLAFAPILAMACASQAPPSPSPPAATPTAEEVIARGEYLVAITGCQECHTPIKMGHSGPEPDMTLMLAGHPEAAPKPEPFVASPSWMWAGAPTNTAFAGPWGVSYSANLTPEEHTGLGIWTEEIFVNAMRTGKHFGEATSRTIMPPMPWISYRQATDDDLKAIYAYLRSIPPIKNAVPPYEPPTP